MTRNAGGGAKHVVRYVCAGGGGVAMDPVVLVVAVAVADAPDCAFLSTVAWQFARR